MEIRKLTCINCPMGCSLEVRIDGEDISVTGNMCGRGYEYGKTEVINPVRTLTTSLFVIGGAKPVVSVKTTMPIPKDKIFDCTRFLAGMKVKAPVRAGDVLVRDILGTGSDIVSTRNVDRNNG